MSTCSADALWLGPRDRYPRVGSQLLNYLRLEGVKCSLNEKKNSFTGTL